MNIVARKLSPAEMYAVEYQRQWMARQAEAFDLKMKLTAAGRAG